jgi:hypothetical protein
VRRRRQRGRGGGNEVDERGVKTEMDQIRWHQKRTLRHDSEETKARLALQKSLKARKKISKTCLTLFVCPPPETHVGSDEKVQHLEAFVFYD